MIAHPEVHNWYQARATWLPGKPCQLEKGLRSFALSRHFCSVFCLDSRRIMAYNGCFPGMDELPGWLPRDGWTLFATLECGFEIQVVVIKGVHLNAFMYRVKAVSEGIMELVKAQPKVTCPWRIDPYTHPRRGWMMKCKQKISLYFCPCWLVIEFYLTN